VHAPSVGKGLTALPASRRAWQLINFHKRRLLALIVQDVQKFQRLRFPFARLAEVQDALLRLPVRSEDDCYAQSIKVEPRETPAPPPDASTASKSVRGGSPSTHVCVIVHR
jgi:hypothetical protein